MAKLKVFRTAAGFHDAYVAAPSRKAALAAWGADKDLFARGLAEEVTDPSLTEAPLAQPGEVIKVSRGGRDEQLAALPEDKPKPKVARVAQKTVAKSKSRPQPKPPRTELDGAEQALAEAQARHEAERAALAEEEAALERRKREAKRAQEAELARLERTRAAAEAEYRAALEAWRDASG